MFKYEKFSASNTQTAPSVERVVEFSPSGVDAENIAKVLSLAVDGKVISAEANDGYAEVAGRANFKLLYLDREGQPKGVDYNADFNIKVEGVFSASDTVAAEIAIVEADVVTGEVLTLSAVVEVKVSCVKRSEVEALRDAEQCYKTVECMKLPSFITAKSLLIPVSDEAEAGDVDRILLVDSSVIVTNAVSGNGTIKVDANASATVTYSEGGVIKSVVFDFPISEDVAVDGVEEGDIVCAESCFRNTRIVLAGVTGANIIRFEGDVAIKLQAYRCRETEIIADMFMLTNEVALDRQQTNFLYFAGAKYSCEKVSGTALLGDNKAAAREIVAIPYSRCYIAKSVPTDGGANIEGVVTADIIYSDENGYNSVRTEVPFSLNINGEFGDDIRCTCVVDKISARVRRDREIEVDASIGIIISEYATVTASYISGVVVGEEKEQNTSALSLYIASDGDEMWDICKALTATPEAIMAQNPTLETPLKDGEKVIYFRALSF